MHWLQTKKIDPLQECLLLPPSLFSLFTACGIIPSWFAKLDHLSAWPCYMASNWISYAINIVVYTLIRLNWSRPTAGPTVMMSDILDLDQVWHRVSAVVILLTNHHDWQSLFDNCPQPITLASYKGPYNCIRLWLCLHLFLFSTAVVSTILVPSPAPALITGLLVICQQTGINLWVTVASNNSVVWSACLLSSLFVMPVIVCKTTGWNYGVSAKEKKNTCHLI